MDFKELFELVAMVAGTSGLAILFYFYFNNTNVKMWVDRAVKSIPLSSLLNIAAANTKDTKGVFDAHDALKVSARLADFIRDTVTDPANVKFRDVEEELYVFLSTELNRYRDAGVRGVPDISDEVLRTNVHVVFDQITRALSEDTA